MYSIQLYDDTAQEYGAKISQGLQSPVSVTERLDGGIDTARFTMHTKLTSPPKQWQKVRLWTQDEPAPPAIEWAASAMPASTTWKSAVYGGGKWLAFGDHGIGEYYAYLSYDNMQSWESIPGDAFFGVKVVGAAYGDKFVVAWDYTSAPGYSSDGINWTFQSGAVTIDQKCIAYGGGRYVVAGEDTHCIYSIDGINWVRVPIDAAAYAWSAIAYGSGKFVILAKGSDKCAYSSDGASWTLGSMPSSGAWASIAYGDKFVAIKDFDSGETNKCAVSADGANWQEKTLPVSARWSKIVYGNGKYVLMSTSGITLISDDAETWEQMQLPASSFWRVLAFGSNVCLAIDGDGATDVCATMKVPDVFPEAYADYFVNNCRSDLITRLPGLKVYRWDVELVGLIKVTQKLPMGNLCFSNDVAEDGTVTQKTYAQVLDRLNNQIFTVLEEDRNDVPFRLRIEPAYVPFLSEYAPELFFTGNTLYECLERIGQTQDSFPELYFYAPGVYTLAYRKYNDPNAERHTNTALNADVQYHEAENHAEIVDSTVENLVMQDADGRGAMVYPARGQYLGVQTEEYEVQITNDNCFFRLPEPAAKILKVEIYAGGDNYFEVTEKVYEYDRWRVLHSSWWDSETQKIVKENRGYYTFNNVQLNSITAIVNRIGGLYSLNPRTAKFRVTYIPLKHLRLKSEKSYNNTGKPLSSIANQQANILDGTEFSKNQQALVDRMSGEYKTPVIKALLGQQYHKGEYLNGETITQAEHTHFYMHVESVYMTSKHYNRKSEFVEVDHNLRQWSIPADKVQDRDLHYADNLAVSIDTPLNEDSTGAFKYIDYLMGYLADTQAYTPPNLAYIAWKNRQEYVADIPDIINGYALAPCPATPLARSIVLSWAAYDNASMGSRTHHASESRLPEIENIDKAQRQQFIAYPEKSEYLQFFVSEEVPTSYIYSNDQTGTQNGVEEVSTNRTFYFTFPMSKKQHYSGLYHAIIDFKTWDDGDAGRVFRIQKDLRERILFNYQLDFMGVNGTIIGEHATFWSNFSNPESLTEVKIYASQTHRYSDLDKKGVGDSQLVTSRAAVTGSHVSFYTDSAVSGLASYAITDGDDNLLYAKNAPAGQTITKGAEVRLYVRCYKKQYVKI